MFCLRCPPSMEGCSGQATEEYGEQLRRAYCCIRCGGRCSLRRFVLCVAHGVLTEVGRSKLLNATNPFDWMELISLDGKTNLLGNVSLPFRVAQEKYYYASGDLIKRHSNIMRVELNDAPAMTPELLYGLIWRPRPPVKGRRRTSYFIKPLIIDLEGRSSMTPDCVGKVRKPRVATRTGLAQQHGEGSAAWHKPGVATSVRVAQQHGTCHD